MLLPVIFTYNFDNNQNLHKSIIAMFLLNHNECQKYLKCTKQSSNHILISLSMLTLNKPKQLKSFETLLLWESRLTRNDKLWWSSGRVQILAWRLGDTVVKLESPRWSRRVDRKCKEHYKSWSQEPKGSCFTASDKLSSSTEFTPQCCFHLVIKQSTFLLRYQETLFKNVIMGLITNSCYLKWKSHLIKIAFQLSGFGYETPVIVIKSLKFDLNFYFQSILRLLRIHSNQIKQLFLSRSLHMKLSKANSKIRTPRSFLFTISSPTRNSCLYRWRL